VAPHREYHSSGSYKQSVPLPRQVLASRCGATNSSGKVVEFSSSHLILIYFGLWHVLPYVYNPLFGCGIFHKYLCGIYFVNAKISKNIDYNYAKKQLTMAKCIAFVRNMSF